VSDTHQFLIVGGRRGRPRTNDPGSSLTVWVPTQLHDRLAKMANQQGVSVSKVAKTLLTRQLRTRRLQASGATIQR
jgi:hypothetical protein